MSSLHDTARLAAEEIRAKAEECDGFVPHEEDMESTIERHFAAYREQVLLDVADRLWWGPNVPEFTARSGGKRRADRLYAVAELRRLAALPAPPSEVTK
jgi:hypothetical protein